MSSGPGQFTTIAKTATLVESGEVQSFDALADRAPHWLMDLWGACDNPVDMQAVFVLVGYSTSEEQFVAWRYCSHDQFNAHRIEGLFLPPGLWSSGPADEAAAAAGPYARNCFKNPEDADAFPAKWSARPPAAVPDSLMDWVTLALRARHERSLQGPDMRVYVAGQLIHTKLRRESSTTMKIWDFDDEGEEFLKMVQCSDHPRSQLAPCHCGSGERFIDCHMREAFEKPCGCGSKKTLRECCLLETADPRDCGSGNRLPSTGADDLAQPVNPTARTAAG